MTRKQEAKNVLNSLGMPTRQQSDICCLDLKTYKKFCDQIAWETDVWIAENPDHMIHLNGDRFMGPHTTAT